MTDLSNHLGPWTGTWSTWLRPGDLHDHSPITLEVRPTDLGWRIDYRGSIGEDPVTGHLIVAADGSGIDWMDTWHTAGEEQHLSGRPPAYDYGPVEAPWTWAISVEPTHDQLVIVHTNRPPDGEPANAVEMRCTRAVT